jgi:hypothetical protein
MQPVTESEAPTRRLLDKVAIGVLIGVVAISVGGAALLSVYLNRLGDAAEGIARVEALPSYAGRPSAVGVDGTFAVNYLLMTTADDGTLEAVLIAHLSASRRDLTLIALPADLIGDDGSARTTLAESYAGDPLRTARAVETITGARMDHQVRLDLDGFAGVVDSLGGIDLGSGTLSGAQVVAYLNGAPDALQRSMRTAALLRAALGRANLGVAIADPNRFDKVMDALTPCLKVDDGLSTAEIRTTMVESRVSADEVVAWPLAAHRTDGGAVADAGSLADLRTALAEDTFPAVAGTPSAMTPAPSGSASATPTPTSSTGTPTGVALKPSGTASADPRIAVASPTPR